MPRKILVVDDDDAARRAFVALLETAGYEVIAAGNLKDARRAMTDERPDLLVTDVRLGEFNGLHLAASNRARIPVIVVTGFPDPVLADVAREFGADFLLKPVKPSELLALVERRLAAVEAAPESVYHPARRWPRKRLTTELPAKVDERTVRVVDISYGGLSLAAQAAPGDELPATFRITFPTASVSVEGQVVWERSSDASWMCGVMVADIEQPAWHRLVDATS